MKSILMSIKPKWIAKIASGEKTVEVRKTVPKCGTPFKVYMYCTNDRKETLNMANGHGFGKKGELYLNGNCYYPEMVGTLNGKVVGEFVCDCITDFWDDNTGFEAEGRDPFYMPCGYAKKATCLTNKQFVEYGKGAPIYGLHISDLKIYDKPKELREFCFSCNRDFGEDQKCYECNHQFVSSDNFEQVDFYCDKTITRPPQSWQFVEEL